MIKEQSRVILVNYKDNYDTTTTTANNSMGFDLSAIQSCVYQKGAAATHSFRVKMSRMNNQADLEHALSSSFFNDCQCFHVFHGFMESLAEIVN